MFNMAFSNGGTIIWSFCKYSRSLHCLFNVSNNSGSCYVVFGS